MCKIHAAVLTAALWTDTRGAHVLVAHILHLGTSLQIPSLNCIPETGWVATENRASELMFLVHSIYFKIHIHAYTTQHTPVHLWSSKKKTRSLLCRRHRLKHHNKFVHWSIHHEHPPCEYGCQLHLLTTIGLPCLICVDKPPHFSDWSTKMWFEVQYYLGKRSMHKQQLHFLLLCFHKLMKRDRFPLRGAEAPQSIIYPSFKSIIFANGNYSECNKTCFSNKTKSKSYFLDQHELSNGGQ